jgi:hypothetical protein
MSFVLAALQAVEEDDGFDVSRGELVTALIVLGIVALVIWIVRQFWWR